MLLTQYIDKEVFNLMLVFTRMAGGLMTMPGYGEAYVQPKARLMLSFALALLLTPVVAQYLPPVTQNPIALAVLLAGEALIGVFLGTLARFMFTALEVGGVIIGFQMSLSNAFAFNPSLKQQGSIIGVILTTTGIVLIFVLDLHHLMLAALVDSYAVFVPGKALPLNDFSEALVIALNQAFIIAVQLGSPFIVIGLTFYLGMGLLGRLMPQLQIFFLAIPIQLMVGTIILSTAFSGIMLWFFSHYESMLEELLVR